MTNYDFRSLNDKEFEALAGDLLATVIGQRIERFKPGKDAGVDGRFFAPSGHETILQYKHWIDTPVSKLILSLNTDELPKIARLNPKRYIIAISKPLSRLDKEKIKNAVAPYTKQASDIFGAEDLNDILRYHPLIEKAHYKLWLQSTSVLQSILNHAIVGRSTYTLQEIREQAATYATTSNHKFAHQKLEHLGVLIITGEPGIGKTTLANHLCIQYVSEGFTFISMTQNLQETENVFDDDSKQLFYFDDFLGRNYLEALTGHEGQRITQFIRRVARNKNKRFILTSRSTILNQGKMLIDSFQLSNTARNEFELRITALTKLDRAHILYNHIWHTQLSSEHVQEIYAEKRYLNIIGHPNFNPRLISYITDAGRLQDVKPPSYWQFIMKSLRNPAAVWENPFEAQQDDYGRTIVLLVVLHRAPISEEELGIAYREYVSRPENQGMTGRRDFIGNMRTLTGSFLNRHLQENLSISIDLFNPSIGDYVLSRYVADISTLSLAFACLRKTTALFTLRSLYTNNALNKKSTIIILKEILQRIDQIGLATHSLIYLAEIAAFTITLEPPDSDVTEILGTISKHILERTYSQTLTDSTFEVVAWGARKGLISAAEALKFSGAFAEDLSSDSEIKAHSRLWKEIPASTPNYLPLKSQVDRAIKDRITENLRDFVECDEIFSSFGSSEHEGAKAEISRQLKDKFSDLGVNFDPNDVLDDFDVQAELLTFHSRDSDRENSQVDDKPDPEELGEDDAIDDLFER
jgi:nucleoside-triphosphatase THEP1